MCLPSLPRLRSQTRHIPALCLFILKIYTEIKTSRGKSIFLVPNLYGKIFLHPMLQNLHTKHGESQSTRTLRASVFDPEFPILQVIPRVIFRVIICITLYTLGVKLFKYPCRLW